jgi:hypothetical protein
VVIPSSPIITDWSFALDRVIALFKKVFCKEVTLIVPSVFTIEAPFLYSPLENLTY